MINEKDFLKILNDRFDQGYDALVSLPMVKNVAMFQEAQEEITMKSVALKLAGHAPVMNFRFRSSKVHEWAEKNNIDVYEDVLAQLFLFRNPDKTSETRYSIYIKTKTDMLCINKKVFKVELPIKYVRKKTKKTLMSNVNIIEIDISHLPYQIIETKHTKSWLGNGIQNDDINCSEEHIVKNKLYDQKMLNEIIDMAINRLEIKGKIIERTYFRNK